MEVTLDRDRYALTVTSAATLEPLTLQEAKAHLKVEDDDDDDVVQRCITAARQYVEKVDGRCFISTTFALRMDRFPSENGAINVPRPPLRSVSSIVYIDTAAATATLSATAYTSDIYSTPGRIVPAYAEYWPTTRDVPNAVTVTFVAGYGTTATSTPEDKKAAMLLAVGDLYENRQGTVVGTITSEIGGVISSILSVDRAGYL